MTNDRIPRIIRPTRTQMTLKRIADGDGAGNASRALALAHACPTCGAKVDKACVSTKGGLRWSFHQDRRPSRRTRATASVRNDLETTSLGFLALLAGIRSQIAIMRLDQRIGEMPTDEELTSLAAVNARADDQKPARGHLAWLIDEAIAERARRPAETRAQDMEYLAQDAFHDDVPDETYARIARRHDMEEECVRREIDEINDRRREMADGDRD
jgi:hypothetical protein